MKLLDLNKLQVVDKKDVVVLHAINHILVKNNDRLFDLAAVATEVCQQLAAHITDDNKDKPLLFDVLLQTDGGINTETFNTISDIILSTLSRVLISRGKSKNDREYRLSVPQELSEVNMQNITLKRLINADPIAKCFTIRITSDLYSYFMIAGD